MSAGVYVELSKIVVFLVYWLCFVMELVSRNLPASVEYVTYFGPGWRTLVALLVVPVWKSARLEYLGLHAGGCL